MRVYKFLSAKFGLKVLREKRLKISELRSLNDPYEQLPFCLSTPELKAALLKSRDDLGREHGMLCFSRKWHNPVLWSHYGDCHRGVSLGFDVLDDLAQAVKYVATPIAVTKLNTDTARSMLCAKYEHWRYEDEVRLWMTLKERSGGLFFAAFGEKLRLCEVILGPRCDLSNRRITQALRGHDTTVAVRRARLADCAFLIEDDPDYRFP